MESSRLKKNLSARKAFKYPENICLLVLVVAISACGTGKPKDTPEGGDAIPNAADAGTDAVPQAAAETPAVSPPPPTTADQPGGKTAVAASSKTEASETQSDSGQPDTYKIKGGDTLMKVAFEVYGDVYRWKDIYEANKDKISDPNAIPKNLVLKITRPSAAVTTAQNGEKYLIKKGDTLGKISDSLYGTKEKWKQIWDDNKLLIHNPNKIFAGFYLFYNVNGVASASAPAAPLAAAPSSAGTAQAAATPDAVPVAPPAVVPDQGAAVAPPPADLAAGNAPAAVAAAPQK